MSTVPRICCRPWSSTRSASLAVLLHEVTRDLSSRNHRSRCTTVGAGHQDTRRPGLEAVQLCLLLELIQEEAVQRRLTSRTRGRHGLTLHSRQALLLLRTVLGDVSLGVALPPHHTLSCPCALPELLPLPSLPLPFGLEVRLVVPAVALPATSLPADRAWRLREVVLGLAFVLALSTRLAQLLGTTR